MTAEPLPHKLTLCERKKLTMTGVTEVISFDDNAVLLKTNLGLLAVQGSELKLKTLSPDGGQVEISGTVTVLSYEDRGSGGGWLSRLFG